jgi:hypothetical protein
MQHHQRRVPRLVTEQALQRGQRAIKQFADRFALQETRVARHRAFAAMNATELRVRDTGRCPGRTPATRPLFEAGGHRRSTCCGRARRTRPLQIARSMRSRPQRSLPHHAGLSVPCSVSGTSSGGCGGRRCRSTRRRRGAQRTAPFPIASACLHEPPASWRSASARESASLSCVRRTGAGRACQLNR